MKRWSKLDLADYLDKKRRLVDQALEKALPMENGMSSTVIEAMRYSLFCGGKRLRPILCLAGAETVGGEEKDALPAAVALEMIHTSSLIHDDLPGMDNDDYRRGRPSSHKVFGEGMAILAGDGLMIEGLGILAGLAGEGVVDPARAVRALDVIACAAGFRGMVGGQAVDLDSENKNVGLDVVRYIHQHKTAALIAASVVSGAILAGADTDQVGRLEHFGQHIGLAFQIIDDILDVEGETDILGKPVGSDEARGKATYTRFIGVSRSREEARRLLAAAANDLMIFGDQAEPLRAIADYLLTRKS
jgi:geranylgeranyl diphosphate synthase, type II